MFCLGRRSPTVHRQSDNVPDKFISTIAVCRPCSKRTPLGNARKRRVSTTAKAEGTTPTAAPRGKAAAREIRTAVELDHLGFDPMVSGEPPCDLSRDSDGG